MLILTCLPTCLGDAAAAEGSIASHRWLGANTAAPLFYGQKEQVEQTVEFLNDRVLSVDIFGVERGGTGELTAPLKTEKENYVRLTPGEELTAVVVIANRKAAHSFPPELRDMYEPWVEFEAVGADGRVIFHSGFIGPDKTLDESAHVYKSILLDHEGRPLTRHQVWLGAAKAYDNFINAGRSDVARFRFRVPGGAGEGRRAGDITLRARVNYRRFIQEYTDYVLRRQKVELTIPVVNMAEASVKIIDAGPTSADTLTAARRVGSARGGISSDPSSATREARRWNDYGIGLLEQAQYGAAAEAFRRASDLSPNDSDLLVNASIAEMRTEQYGLERGQLRKAAVLLERALRINPADPRVRFFRALLRRSEGKTAQAADELGQLALKFPRDREVQRQLGLTLYALGRVAGSRAAFEAVLAIDPNDAGAYQFLSPIYASEGRKEDAERANALYLLWRDDPLADSVAARFFASNPQWSDERLWSHSHGEGSPLRPTLAGRFAAPDK